MRGIDQCRAVGEGQVHSGGRNVAVQLLRVAHRGRDRVPGGEGQVEEMAADAPCRSDDRDVHLASRQPSL